jgi:hypothetical protein
VIRVEMDHDVMTLAFYCNGELIHVQRDMPLNCQFAAGGARGTTRICISSRELDNSAIAAAALILGARVLAVRGPPRAVKRP